MRSDSNRINQKPIALAERNQSMPAPESAKTDIYVPSKEINHHVAEIPYDKQYLEQFQHVHETLSKIELGQLKPAEVKELAKQHQEAIAQLKNLSEHDQKIADQLSAMVKDLPKLQEYQVAYQAWNKAYVAATPETDKPRSLQPHAWAEVTELLQKSRDLITAMSYFQKAAEKQLEEEAKIADVRQLIEEHYEIAKQEVKLLKPKTGWWGWIVGDKKQSIDKDQLGFFSLRSG